MQTAAGVRVVGYLPHQTDDRVFLAANSLDPDRFYLLPDPVEIGEHFEVFTRTGNVFEVRTDRMIPICLDDHYGDLFLVKYFADDSRVIRQAPVSVEIVLEEIKPVLQAGCVPLLFTKTQYEPSMDPFAMRLVLERMVGFRTEGDAVLAQIIAENQNRD